MSRHARYASRFEFIREAAFALVLREGTAALTRRAIAAELGISDATVRRLVAADVPLACLAADEVVRRRRRAWLDVRTAAELVTLLVPDAQSAPTELVWWRLVLDWASVETPPGDEACTLIERYQLADRGLVLEAHDAERPASGQLRPELGHHVAERHSEIARLVTRLVPAAETARHQLIHALADGLAIAVCTGRLEPDAARQILLHHAGLPTGQAA